MIARQDVPFEWVKNAARYRDKKTKSFVKVNDVRKWADESIEATQQVVIDASQNANADPQGWRDTMRDEIKGEYIRQYLAGKGGRNNMTQADWGSVGGMIADQYRYLGDFYDEVRTGDLSDAAIAARSAMYINSAREAFNVAMRRVHKKAGYKEKRWVLTIAEHCKNCPILAALGWVSIDFKYKVDGRIAEPGNGATQCLTNCKCRLEFRKKKR